MPSGAMPALKFVGLALLISLQLYFLGCSKVSGDESRWQVYRRCRLKTATYALSGRKLNKQDGDSFNVDCQQDGENPAFEKEIRLYFVDAPEAKFKEYKDGKNNGKRLDEQAAYFLLSRDEVTVVGVQARNFTQKFLSSGVGAHQGGYFAVTTVAERVYGDPERIYGFVWHHVESGAKRFLHEELVKAGLVRLGKTKGPDALCLEGDPCGVVNKAKLKAYEDQARKKNAGGWYHTAKNWHRKTHRDDIEL